MTTTSRAAVPTAIVWDEALLQYEFSRAHPMAPVRLDLTHRLCRDLGLLDRPGVRILAPEVADDALLATVHDPEYVRAVRSVSGGEVADRRDLGLGSEDNPVFPHLHEAAARIVGGSVAAAEEVWSGRVRHAVNVAGGLHHAARGHASGFCIYNDCAAAIRRLLDLGAERVAYVDLDAHHGDGVESIFWDDPRVLTISVHETGISLFPGSGFANDVGGPEALGSAVNVALPPGTGDSGFLRAVHAVVPQLLGAFAPDALVTQHGCDGHRDDPLTNLTMSVEGQRQLALDAADWARDHAHDRWLATGGGGYSPYSVVPRTWSHLVAVATGRPLAPETPVPAEWRRYAEQCAGEGAHERIPALMSDGVDVWWRSWEVGYDPSDAIDQTIMATRKSVFPYHGLDPWFD
ncbi:acetoin utilization protein AcuC [Citricoccus sp. SGAir0253]|uniref:acetoin utilization protein AcuC n=1 Tax=Citricoccus sp. SGAir0253 TaxID=2567881 RepID=UPI0010CCCB77|nr:acetoin utilization protein AcuC [Citricoccus sp. SGAir0253]QCU77357.1 acetoin utilization protein AcuC [Citricoccus sp. SGAir0253]